MGWDHFEESVAADPYPHRIQISAGDFGEGMSATLDDSDALIVTEGPDPEVIVPLRELESLEYVADEDGGLGGVVWPLAGCLLAGPIGLIIGIFLGQQKRVTFVAHFSDGKRMSGTAPERTYKEMLTHTGPLTRQR